MTIYIFYRKDGWCTLTLVDDESAVTNAECNPGTLKVEEGKTGRIVWRAEKEGGE